MLALFQNEVVTDYWNLVGWGIGRFELRGSTGAALLYLCGAILCIVIPYLLGSINPAILISKTVYRDDIRTHGSGNAGTTNMLRTFGVKAAVATMLLDFGKAIVATLLGGLILGELGQAIGGFFVGFGHMFPIYYRFRGGKGVACFAMVALVINPWVFLGILGTFVVVLIGTRFVSLASVMAALMFPMFMNAFASHKSGCVAMAVFAACFVIYMHRANLGRIWKNEESRIDFSKFKRSKKSDEEPVTEEAAEASEDTDGEDDAHE